MTPPTEASPLLRRTDGLEIEPQNGEDTRYGRRGLSFLSTLAIGMVAFFTLLMLEWRFEVVNSNAVDFQLRGPTNDPSSESSFIPGWLHSWSSPPPKILGNSQKDPDESSGSSEESSGSSEETSGSSEESSGSSDGEKTVEVNINSESSFSELAVSMIQQSYAESLEVIDTVFVESVQPGEVASPRKTLLKTRDLLDIFSPIYPGNTSGKKDDGFDLWTELRHELAKGYQIVGEFLDLNHAHINYTKASCEGLRQDVLEWKANFTRFRQEHPEIPVYLASPLRTSGQVHHAKESRFYWEDTPKELLPKGASPATPALQTLGIHQANLALDYLNHTMTFQRIIASHSPEEQLERQETFHNLRKTLRSMCDEVDLLGANAFLAKNPMAHNMDGAWALLSSARGVLGDLNDMWTAYDYYVQHDLHYLEQDRLALGVDTAFMDFQQWARDVDLEGELRYMIQIMMIGSSSIASDSTNDSNRNGKKESNKAVYKRKRKSLTMYLKLAKKYPTHSIVIGNQAGDADSVISAISLAYIETYSPQTTESLLTRKTPIVSIPKQDLDELSPEINLLLQLAGISNPSKELLFVDSKAFKKHMHDAQVTLVDHNDIEDKFQKRHWNVIEVVDHHHDEGLYLNASPRNIAYDEDNDEALVASTCTLVAERMMKVWDPPYPASVGLLLLGVILLDSVNLSPQAGKVTQRDIDAVQKLVENTDWLELPRDSQLPIGIRDYRSKDYPDINEIFQLLQDAKYNESFWESISVHDALRYDYKDYDYKDGIFGISSLLMPMDDFLHKRKVMSAISRFMKKFGISFLAIMFTYERNGDLRRELMICSDRKKSHIKIGELENKLLASSLHLKELPEVDAHTKEAGLESRFFRQENVAASRKQIGPLLQESLNNLL